MKIKCVISVTILVLLVMVVRVLLVILVDIVIISLLIVLLVRIYVYLNALINTMGGCWMRLASSLYVWSVMPVA